MSDYSCISLLESAYGPGSTAAWINEHLAELNSFSGTKNIDDEQTKALARFLAHEYRDMKISLMLLFFYRFKCGHFGKFWGKVDPMVITCALKDFAEECKVKREKYLNEEHLARRQREDELREFVYHQWWKLCGELCQQFPEQENIAGVIFIDKIFAADKVIQLSVTKEQYEFLERDHIDVFGLLFRKYFVGMNIRYKLRPQQSEQEDAVTERGKLRRRSQLVAEIEDGCRSAHVVIANSLRLDGDGITAQRDAFRKRYKHFPEEYLEIHEKTK